MELTASSRKLPVSPRRSSSARRIAASGSGDRCAGSTRCARGRPGSGNRVGIRTSLCPLKRNLPAEAIVGRCCRATSVASSPARSACSTRTSPSSSRIAIQRAFGTPGAAASMSGTSSAMAALNSRVPCGRFGCVASLAADHAFDRRQQRVNAFRRARDDRHRGHAEIARQAAHVDVDPLAPGFVHQVHGHDDLVGDLEHLQHEIQIALERGCVDDDDRAVGGAEEQEVARDLLVVRRRQQRVRARQIDELVVLSVELRSRLPRA